VLCREEAADLCSALAGEDVPVYGVVKEEELVDVEPDKLLGLEEFETNYFCGPLFLSDEARSLYELLGNQPIFTLGTLGKAIMNPLKTRRELKAMGERMKSKNLEGNMVGDGLTKGGIFCVNSDGELLYTFYEDAGQGVPAEAQEKILTAVRSFTPAAAAVA